jgi:hypothetical protein
VRRLEDQLGALAESLAARLGMPEAQTLLGEPLRTGLFMVAHMPSSELPASEPGATSVGSVAVSVAWFWPLEESSVPEAQEGAVWLAAEMAKMADVAWVSEPELDGQFGAIWAVELHVRGSP